MAFGRHKQMLAASYSYHRQINKAAKRLSRERTRLINALGVGAFLVVFAVAQAASPAFMYAFYVIPIIWIIAYVRTINRVIEGIVRGRLCMNCGYNVSATPTFDSRTDQGTGFDANLDKRGVCPECGELFQQRDFHPPQAGYLSGRLDEFTRPEEDGD